MTRFQNIMIAFNTLLKEGYPKWTKPEPFPDHVKTTGECPTLSNTACSNLTLINVSQSDGTGYYTITAENECGSNNFTVYVLVMNPHPCLNATELPPLLNPPPPNIRAVEGQTVTVTATYKGDYNLDSLGAMYGVMTANNKKYKYITPDDTPSSGYNVTVDNECPVTNISCCYFNVSISVGPITLATSDIELKVQLSGQMIGHTTIQGIARLECTGLPQLLSSLTALVRTLLQAILPNSHVHTMLVLIQT
ncbi:uncharacterized protein [Dysidea avara]|uniref:uncharacterized protein n=1 Tax=Dysidea avara TaxID=196820 RepID=UPI00333126F7